MAGTAGSDVVADVDGEDLELLAEARRGYEKLVDEIGRVIVGQHGIVRLLLASIFSEGHSLIIGVPGLAKTLLVKTLASVLGWEFKRIQFTPDMMPADIIGMELLQDESVLGGVGVGGGGRVMRFVRGPVFANIVLADEINRTPPKTQAALLEAMQEYTVTSMGSTHALEKPFVVIATQNPIEQEGTYPLPEAQLDRFMFSLRMDYPTREEECAMVCATTSVSDVEIEPVFDAVRMRGIQGLVRRVPASAHVVEYAVSLARATRPAGMGDGDGMGGELDYVKRYVEWGAGPRGGQHMILAAKALAVLDGEPAVGARHVREAAMPVLGHRVLPNYQAMGQGITGSAIVQHVLDQVCEPDYVS